MVMDISNMVEPFIILRHDVDVSLESALQMAVLEHEKDIHSTYFILLHSPHYNALSEGSSKIINKISNLGHEIGLHYDTSFLDEDNILQEITIESEILSKIIKKDVMTIAQHNTSIVPQKKIDLGDFIDPLKSKIFQNVKYITDSVQNWRSGCMCNHVNDNYNIQFLTHPIWWNFKSVGREECLAGLRVKEMGNLNKRITIMDDIQKEYIRNIKGKNS